MNKKSDLKKTYGYKKKFLTRGDFTKFLIPID